MSTTVVIPFFNAQATLADAIRSVFAQTDTDWELLLMDDGSTDDSVRIARSVRDPRVTVWHDGENRGVAARRNQAATIARGKYVAWLDDDDIMHPERLACQVAHLERHPHIDLLGTAAYTITLGGLVSGWRAADAGDLTYSDIVSRCVLLQPTVTNRTEWSRRHLYDEQYWRGQDHELFCRTYPHSTFELLPARLVFYREGRSRTVAKYRCGCQDSRRVFRRYGPSAVGLAGTARLLATSYAKELAYAALWYCGAEENAIRRHRAALAPAELCAASEALARVRATYVPGFVDVVTSRATVTPVTSGRDAL